MSPLLARPFLTTRKTEDSSRCYGSLNTPITWDNTSSMSYSGHGSTSNPPTFVILSTPQAYEQSNSTTYGPVSEIISINSTASAGDILALIDTPIWKAFLIAGVIILIAALCNIFQYICDPQSGTPPVNTTEEKQHKTTSSTHQSALVRLLIVQMGVFMFVVGCMQRSAVSYLFAYAVHCHSWEKSQAVFLKTAYQSGVLGGLLISIPLLLCVKPQVLLVTCCLVSIVALSGLSFAGSQQVVMWLSTVLVGLCMGPIYGCSLSWGNQHYSVSGKVGSIFTFFISASDIIGSLLINLLYDRFGLATYAYFSLTLTILMTVIVLSMFLTINCIQAKKPQYAMATAYMAEPMATDTDLWKE